MDNFAAAPETSGDMLSYEDFRLEVVSDYRLAFESRETSLLGRKGLGFELGASIKSRTSHMAEACKLFT